ncbi:MAG: hypothetical protein V1493_05785 [Candidatus Diapherotrites archaeon]
MPEPPHKPMPRKPHPISDPAVKAKVTAGFQEICANIGKPGQTERIRELRRFITSSSGPIDGVATAKLQKALDLLSARHSKVLPKVVPSGDIAEKRQREDSAAELQHIRDFASGRARPVREVPRQAAPVQQAPIKKNLFENRAEELNAAVEARASKGTFGFDHWERTNRAYGEMIKDTGIAPLWDVFFREGRGRVSRDKRREYGNVKGVQGYYDWPNFHEKIGQALRSPQFGEANLRALARIVENASQAGMSIREIDPKGNAIIVTVDGGALHPYVNTAIEAMKDGKITKVGDPAKYDKRLVKERHGGDVSKLQETEALWKDKYDREMAFLNDLITSPEAARRHPNPQRERHRGLPF